MLQEKTKFAFFGTPDVASETLEILKQSGYMPSLIVTAPDRPSGRKMLLTPPPVKTWAIENNIPYLQPEKLDSEFTLKLSTFNPASPADRFQLFIVVAYGKILSREIIEIPKLGSINIHYSLLPKHRGASPVEASILLGDTETGVSIQQMEFKMDSGPILTQQKVAIGQTETSPELRTRLIKLGGELLVRMLPDFLERKITPTPQNEEEVSYCKKIKKEDGLVDLAVESPSEIYNKFRAYAKWPRTYFFREGKRIIITDAELEDGKFVIKKVIPEGGKEILYKE